VGAILRGYARGTRFGIHMDADALLMAGEPGYQLTWMDARANGREVTPRIGKPVEVQALWINALRIGCSFWSRWEEPLERARAAFVRRFWNEDGGYLFDVIDVDGRWGEVDASFRPNQVLAVGGLPFRTIDGASRHALAMARRLMGNVASLLWTPLGLRSLAPGEPGYAAHYTGGVAERDGAYHQGTVWPWLTGPFVDAWVYTAGGSDAARAEARARFIAPLFAHLATAGLGHISEIADAEAPYTPRGAPFQAWSLGELLRVLHGQLAPRGEPASAS
jgi:predicted glycogen debranching enzyme